MASDDLPTDSEEAAFEVLPSLRNVSPPEGGGTPSSPHDEWVELSQHLPRLPSAEFEMLRSLREVFPDGCFPDGGRGIPPSPHDEWVDLRQHMPRLQPEDVKEFLPGVLYDLVLSRDRFMEEYGDLVIYFLDVIGEDGEDVAGMRDLITDFADNCLGGDQGELLKYVMLTELPAHPFLALSEAEKRAYLYTSREASFTDLTPVQSCAVYRWLAIAWSWDEVDFCRRDVERALVYWRGRCERPSGEEKGTHLTSGD